MTRPAVEHLLSCSLAELQQLELTALDLHSQCVKRAEAELKEAIAYRGDAEVFRFLIGERENLIRLSRTIADGKQIPLRFPDHALVKQPITRRSA